MVVSAVMAFTKWDLLTPPSFVGLDNFRKAFSGDPLVGHSLKVTMLYALLAVPLNIVLGLGLALLPVGKRGTGDGGTAWSIAVMITGVSAACLLQTLTGPNISEVKG